MKLNKIVIWGTVASGKTTLARMLSSTLNISNVVHTDKVIFGDDFQEKEKTQALETINKHLNQPLANRPFRGGLSLGYLYLSPCRSYWVISLLVGSTVR